MLSQRHNILIFTTFLTFLIGACTTSPTGRSQMILKSDAELQAQASKEFAKLRSEAPRNPLSEFLSYRDASRQWADASRL